MGDYRATEELKYSLWKIIDVYRDSSLGGVNGLRFNKMMALLNHRLLDEKGLDIKLPRCWYLYGEATVPKQLPDELRWEGLDKEERETLGRWSEERPEIRSSKNRKKIDSIIDSLYSLFPPDEDVKKAIKEDYNKYAPYEFQRLYKAFRYDTQIESMVDKDGSLRSEVFYSKEIQEAMKRFPYEDFPELKVVARKIELLLPSLFEEFPEKNEKGIEMAKDFWKIFCRFLRIKKNNYVDSERIRYWDEVAVEDLKKYREGLKKDIRDLKELEMDVTKDPMVELFLSPESLGPGSEDLSESVDKMVYG